MKQAFITTVLVFYTIASFALTGFGDSEIFSIMSETLPVELSSFTAVQTGMNSVQLCWVVQSETNLSGYYIYRNRCDALSTALLASTLIQPVNTSSGHTYHYEDTEVYPNQAYYYWLHSVDLDGSSAYYGPVSIFTNLDSDQDIPSIPFITGLKSIYPNPFNPSTTISYQLSTPQLARISIYNIRGQIVQQYEREHSEPGHYILSFDGIDARGRALSNGIYFVVMRAGTKVSKLKMAMVK